MNPSYISENRKELFESAPADIKELIKGGEVKVVVTTLAEKYGLIVGQYNGLANIISYVLIGALDPKNVITAIKDILKLDDKTSNLIAQELETGIFQKAREITIGKQEKGEEPVAKLEFQGKKTPDELRKEIMDTTKRTSAINVPQTSGIPKKSTPMTPGSRSQLLEQLQILGSIPKDEEIEARLKHIQEQISSIKKVEEDNSLQSNIALKSFMFGEKGKETAEAVMKTATYSVAPTHYNLDPYREVSED